MAVGGCAQSQAVGKDHLHGAVVDTVCSCGAKCEGASSIWTFSMSGLRSLRAPFEVSDVRCPPGST